MARDTTLVASEVQSRRFIKSEVCYEAHETAVIDAGASVGMGSKIWHFCHITSRAEIGVNCILGQNVYIGDCEIGHGVKIQNNVSVYSGVTVEDDVFIGPSAVFTNVINPRAFIERKDEFLPTLVKKGATIGANATILCGVTLGKYCLVGAGSVVVSDVPDYAVVVGNPAKIIKYTNREACLCQQL